MGDSPSFFLAAVSSSGVMSDAPWDRLIGYLSGVLDAIGSCVLMPSIVLRRALNRVIDSTIKDLYSPMNSPLWES